MNEFEFVEIPQDQDADDFRMGVKERVEPDISNFEFIEVPVGESIVRAGDVLQDTTAEDSEAAEKDSVSGYSDHFRSSKVLNEKQDVGLESSLMGADFSYEDTEVGPTDDWQKVIDKWSYLQDTAFGMSMTGMVLRGTVDPGFDETYEADLDLMDKSIRFMLSLGPDAWTFMLGGALPRVAIGAEGAIRSLPMFTRAAPTIAKAVKPSLPMSSGSMMGFYQGMREVYSQRVWSDSPESQERYPDMVGRGLWDVVMETMKGTSIGVAAGTGQAIRDKLFAQAASRLSGAAKYGGVFAAESAMLGVLQSQLDDPLVMPTYQTFAEGLATDSMMEVVSLLAPATGRLSGLRRSWYAKKYVDAYTNNGAHPHTVAHDALNDSSVMEDLSNQTTDRIRKYDSDGGAPLDPSETMLQYNRAVEESTRPPTSGLVDDLRASDDAAQAVGAAGDVVTTKPGDDPPPLEFGTGVETPIKLYDGDDYTAVVAPDGTLAVLPTTRGRSLALSRNGMVNSPTISNLIKQITGSLPKLEDIKSGALGYFAPAEYSRSVELKDTTTRIRSLVNKRVRIRGRGQSTAVYDAAIDTLTKKAEDLNSRAEVSAAETHIRASFEVAKDPGALMGTLTHETGHLLDYLSKKFKTYGSSVILSGHVGNHIFSYVDDVGEMMSESAQYGVDPNKIQQEAVFLSKLWRPISEEGFNHVGADGVAYRLKGAELTADVVSVRLNNPDIMQRWAPNIAKVFDQFYDSRPEMGDRMRKLEKDLHDGSSMDAVEDAMKGGFLDSEKKLVDAQQVGSEQGQMERESIATGTWTKIGDTYASVLKAVGRNVEVNNATQNHQYVTTHQQTYMKKLHKGVLSKLSERGISKEDFGLLMFYNRVINDSTREQLANAYGFSKQTAEQQMESMKQKYNTLAGEHKVEDLLKDLHEVRKSTIVPLIKKSGLASDAFLRLLEDNESYARFEVKEYFDAALEDGLVTRSDSRADFLTASEASAYAQKGSLGEIVNPLAATIRNDLELFDRTLKTIAKRDAVMAMFEATATRNDVPVIPAEEFDAISATERYRFGPYGVETLRQSTVSFPERRWDSKKKEFTTVRRTFHVPPDIKEAFSPKYGSATQKLMSHLATSSFLDLSKAAVKGDWKAGLAAGASAWMNTNRFWRFFVVTSNVTFQTANLAYDASRTYYNMPGVKKSMLLALTYDMGKHYKKSTVDSFAAVWGDRMSPEQQKLEDDALISTSMRFVDDAIDTTMVDRMMHQYGVEGMYGKVDTTVGKLKFGAAKIDTAMGKFFESTERIHKQAANEYLTEQVKNGSLILDGEQILRPVKKDNRVAISGDIPSVVKAAIDIHVRTKAGSPAFNRRGTETTTANAILPFFNTMKEGMRADFDAFKDDKASMMTKLLVSSMLPAAAMAFIEEGIFDVDTDDSDFGNFSAIMDTKTEFTKNNRLTIPMSMGPGGKGFALTVPLPQQPFIRFTHSATRKLVKSAIQAARGGDEESKTFLDNIGGAVSEVLRTPMVDVPSLAPLPSIGLDLYSLAKNNNVYDKYFGGMKFSGSRELEVEESYTEKLQEATKIALKGMGTPRELMKLSEKGAIDSQLDNINSIMSPQPEDDTGTLARAANAVFDSPISRFVFGGYFNYGDEGWSEKVYEAGHESELEVARDRLAARAQFEDAIEARDTLEPITLSLENDRQARQLRGMFRTQSLKDIQNPYIRQILSAGSDKKKLDLAFRRANSTNEGRKALQQANQ